MEHKETTISEGRIKDLKNKIFELERNVEELRKLGEGMKMIEKNARSLQSLIHVLHKDVPDISGEI